MIMESNLWQNEVYWVVILSNYIKNVLANINHVEAKVKGSKPVQSHKFDIVKLSVKLITALNIPTTKIY